MIDAALSLALPGPGAPRPGASRPPWPSTAARRSSRGSSHGAECGRASWPPSSGPPELGLHDPGLLPDADARGGTRRARPGARRGDPRGRRLRRRRPDGPGDPRDRAAAAGTRRRRPRAEPPRRRPRAVDARRRGRPRRRTLTRVHRRHRDLERRRGCGRGRSRHRRHRSPTTTGSPTCCRPRSPSSTRSVPTPCTRTAAWPAAASPSRSRRCCLDRLAGIPWAETVAGLADLATIGTVADVAPILGENRSIARLGLERLRSAPRPGLAALLAAGGVTPGAVTLETIAFVIAPRLNAAGRVGDAADAAALLLADDRGGGRRSRSGARTGEPDAPRRDAGCARRGAGCTDRRAAGSARNDRAGTMAGRDRGADRRASRRGAELPAVVGCGARRDAACLVPRPGRLRPRRHARRLRRPADPPRRPPWRRRARGPCRSLGRVPGTVPRPCGRGRPGGSPAGDPPRPRAAGPCGGLPRCCAHLAGARPDRAREPRARSSASTVSP